MYIIFVAIDTYGGYGIGINLNIKLIVNDIFL